MALRDQPYIPLYIQDIMTDEKLNECSASAAGIYIKGYMCLMHKSEVYGKILLRQKDKQTPDQVQNFSAKVAKHLPYSEAEVYAATLELLTEGVLFLDGDSICQKRMIKDNEVSCKRSESGKTGAAKTHVGKRKGKIKKFAIAKVLANSEYENEYENEFNLDFVDEKFKDSFFKFLKYRKDKKDPFKLQQSVELKYRELLKLSESNPVTAAEIVDQTISNQWQGLFKLKQDGKQTNTDAHLKY